MSNRFYVPEILPNEPVILSGPEAQHMTRVMRLGTGDCVILFNGQGDEAAAEIVSHERNQVTLQPGTPQAVDRELPFRLTAGVALPKSDRLKFMIEKLTELGVTDLVPLTWTRSAVIPRGGTIKKMKRYVIEASKQCGRNVLMNIMEPASFATWCSAANPEVTRLCCDTIDTKPVVDALTSKAGSVIYCVGPEGGLTDDERRLARQHGWQPVGLGPRTLRIETAALTAAISVITLRQRYEVQD